MQLRRQALSNVHLDIDGRHPMRERCSSLWLPQPHRILPLRCSLLMEMRAQCVCRDLAPRCAADALQCVCVECSKRLGDRLWPSRPGSQWYRVWKSTHSTVALPGGRSTDRRNGRTLYAAMQHAEDKTAVPQGRLSRIPTAPQLHALLRRDMLAQT